MSRKSKKDREERELLLYLNDHRKNENRRLRQFKQGVYVDDDAEIGLEEKKKQDRKSELDHIHTVEKELSHELERKLGNSVKVDIEEHLKQELADELDEIEHKLERKLGNKYRFNVDVIVDVHVSIEGKLAIE
jgi:hypothetical protein